MIALLALSLSSASTIPPEREALRKAAVLCDHGNWRAAEPFLRESLARFEARDSDEVWEMKLLLGDALTARAKYQEAAQVLAAEPPTRLAHSTIAIRRLLEQAVLAFRLKDAPGANRFLIKAEGLARNDQPLLLADVLGRRAVIETWQRSFEAAERDARQSISLARKQHNRIFEINALGTLGRLRTYQRRYDEAVAYQRRALALATEIDARSKIEKISGNLGWALILLGDFDTASDHFTSALSIAEDIGAEYDIVPWLSSLGDIALHNHDYRKALDYYQRGVIAARRIGHPDLAEFTANTAVALLELGDAAAARKMNDDARMLVSDSPGSEQQLRSVLIDAQIDASVGQLDAAVAKAKRVIEAAKTKAQRWEAEARLAQFYVAAGNSSDAGNHFRRAIDTASDTRNDIQNEELRLPFGALVREVNEAYVRFLIDGGHIAEALEVAESSRAQTLDEALESAESKRDFDPQRIARERSAVILSYWLAPKQSYVWIITGSSIEMERLPPAKVIEDEIDLYARDIQALRSKAASRAHAAKLYSSLVPKVPSRVMPLGARVIVIPDGRLHAFNLETLVNPTTLRYWIEDVTLETANSLELLDAAQSTRGPRSMLLVGDPPSPDRDFPPLTNAADEISRVKRQFGNGCTILQGSAATPRAYERANAGRYGFIHFVAHGIATRQRPLDSAVVLARDGDGDSYKLYARDILKHRLQARLVTISSCHGAGRRAYTGEGLVGLAWAFLHAGAQQVIASLWEVNDNATPKLMDDLYGGIRAGRDPATSLRNAKLSLIRGGTVYQHPKYWAPFVLYSGS